MPNVSIVMCCYNSELYIREAIDSVLKQSYEDFEFIIWNDGSTDSTVDIIKSYNDSRIRYFFHENTGVGVARSLAGEKAQGRFVAVIDSDDVCFPHRIEKEVAFLESHPSYVLVSSQMVYIGQKGEQLGYSFSVMSDFVIRRKMKENSVISHSGCMYRRSAYEKVGGYSGITLGEDHVLFAKMLKYGKAYIMPYTLVKYRIRDLSLMHSIKENSYLSILCAYRRKMISDEMISDADVDVYNRLYQLGRDSIKSFGSDNEAYNHKSLEEKLLDMLRQLFEEHIAMTLIVYLKNAFFFVYYTLRRL